MDMYWCDCFFLGDIAGTGGGILTADGFLDFYLGKKSVCRQIVCGPINAANKCIIYIFKLYIYFYVGGPYIQHTRILWRGLKMEER